MSYIDRTSLIIIQHINILCIHLAAACNASGQSVPRRKKKRKRSSSHSLDLWISKKLVGHVQSVAKKVSV